MKTAALFLTVAFMLFPAMLGQADEKGGKMKPRSWEDAGPASSAHMSVTDIRAEKRKPPLPNGVIPAPSLKYPRNEKIRIAEPKILEVAGPAVKPANRPAHAAKPPSKIAAPEK